MSSSSRPGHRLAARRRARADRRILQRFMEEETSSGKVLVVAAIVAMVWANSPWSDSYQSLWGSTVSFGPNGHSIGLTLRNWVNDGLMTVFFLVVGLEINREFTSGHLRGRRAATLPVVAALGGMAVPAVVYLMIAGSTDGRGWGIPMATDIALALGVVAVVGRSLPTSLRAFLLGLAVVDDIGAIVVIAVVYSSGVHWLWLVAAAASLTLVMVGRRVGAARLPVHVILGVVMWYALHRAGVHPTLAGVVMGLAAPADRLVTRHDVPLIEYLEGLLHPCSSMMIIPVFALANAGIGLGRNLGAAVTSPVAWGIFLGLVIGKPVGVVVVTRLAESGRWADRPEGASGRHILGVGHAAGIGFTVALFISELAFDDENLVAQAKIAILAGSVVSAVAAAVVLRGAVTDAQSASRPSTDASPSR